MTPGVAFIAKPQPFADATLAGVLFTQDEAVTSARTELGDVVSVREHMGFREGLNAVLDGKHPLARQRTLRRIAEYGAGKGATVARVRDYSVFKDVDNEQRQFSVSVQFYR